mgnify:CR=1 FL=1
MLLTGLRLYIEALRGLDEIQEIDAPVSLDLELGAIIRRCIESSAPAPLFNAFSDHPGSFRILGAPDGTSAQLGIELARVAVAQGLPPTTRGLAIVEMIAASVDKPTVDPVIVDDALVFENTLTGDAVHLAALPMPLLH